MEYLKCAASAAALFALATSPSSAVVIDFGAHTVLLSNSIVINEGGYTITATGKGTDALGNPVNNAKVIRIGPPVNGPNRGGLGVFSADDTNLLIDGGISLLRPTNVKDLLLLTFTKAVKIVGLSFGLVENDRFGPDRAKITVDGASMGNLDISTFGYPTFLATGGWVGTTFGFSALGQNDEFLLRAISVTPIPLPPAALLLATSAIAMGALKRRRDNNS
jgi:hypothetical protein